MLFQKYLLLILPIFFLSSCWSSKIKLQEGDLLFKQEVNDTFSKAIVSSTIKKSDSYHFTHVGVAHYENNKWFVIEAVTKGVCKTPIENFITKKSVVVVGRLLKQYQPVIPEAMEKIKSKIGGSYDHYFLANNNAYYCSELIQQHYTQNDRPIFAPIKMTFKDLKTGVFPPYWKTHFKKLKVPIPEGEKGSNPTQLSKSNKLKIIGEYH